MQRVVGILTEGLEMRRLVREDPEGDFKTTGVVEAMLGEILPDVEVPADATAHEIAEAVGQEIGPAVKRMVGAFTLAFVTLAEAYDEGRADVSVADVLRSISLHFENDEQE